MWRTMTYTAGLRIIIYKYIHLEFSALLINIFTITYGYFKVNFPEYRPVYSQVKTIHLRDKITRKRTKKIKDIGQLILG